MKLSSEELKQAILGKTDEELYDAVYVHSADYTPEALEIAKREFLARRVDAETLTQFSSAADVRQKHEQAQEEAPLEGYLKVVAFLFSTLFLGIPVLLAYNHYVNRGARRKAREWIGWAAAGFFFFFWRSRSIGINYGACFPTLNLFVASSLIRILRGCAAFFASALARGSLGGM